jgi:OmpA-OmpF porin, OOP family
MNLKALITLVAFIALVLYGSDWWCKNKGLCGCGTDESTAIVTETASDDGIIRFGNNNNNAILGSGWDNFRDSICNLLRGGKRVEVTGYYSATETNSTPATFLNLGLARADTIKKLLAQCTGINANRITTLAELQENLATASSPFNASKVQVKDTVATPSANGGVVISDSNNIIIYFPSGSSAKEANPEVDNYLTSLGAKLKTSGQTAVITGHTDNKGNASKNLTLSKERAEFVKNLLITKGADGSKISADGKGDQEPLGDNNSDAGRRQNRRVQIHLN